jgi:hypothetical protein
MVWLPSCPDDVFVYQFDTMNCGYTSFTLTGLSVRLPTDFIMEFLKVCFFERRKVIIDDAQTEWVTNESIQLDGGLHTIALAGDGAMPDIAFPPKTVNLRFTSVLHPLSVVFP